MAVSIRVSRQALTTIDDIRTMRGWTKADQQWLKEAQVSSSSLRRFWRGDAITRDSFIRICKAVGVEWQNVVDRAVPDKEEKPDSQVAPASTFYVERPPIEERCYEAIFLRPGVLVRIKAPQGMGKSLLIARLLERAVQHNWRTVVFDLLQLDSAVFADLHQFLRAFCAGVSDSLEILPELDQHWQDIFPANYNSTIYFERYLLPKIDSPLVLALDNLDLVFEEPKISDDVCKLLRSWHQKASSNQIWQNCRLLLAHSTEVYGSNDINASPLANVGLVVELPEFSPQQVKALVEKQALDLDDNQVEQLMTLVGGHPYLVQQALDYISFKQVKLDRLCEAATTEVGPYGNHLRQTLKTLQNHPELEAAFTKVLRAKEPVALLPEQTFKLYGMGLVQLEGNRMKPRCELYRQYFSEYLKEN